MKKFLFLFLACVLIASCQQLLGQEILTLTYKTIEFEKNSYIPKNEDITFLSTLHSSQIYSIEGYASAEGNAPHNKKLSAKRAILVAEYLSVDTSDITFVAAGETTIFGNESQNRIVIVRYWESHREDYITEKEPLVEPERERGRVIPSSFTALSSAPAPIDTIYVVDTIRVIQRDTVIQTVKILPLNDAVKYLMRHRKMSRREAWEYIRKQEELMNFQNMEWETNPIRKVSYTRTQSRAKIPTKKVDRRWLKKKIAKVFPNIWCKKRKK